MTKLTEEETKELSKKIAALKLDAVATKVLGKMSDDEQKYLLRLEPEAIRELVAEMIKSAEDNTTLKDVDLKENLFEDEKGHTFNLGEFAFRKGAAFTAQFLGLRYLFSKNPKENWEEVISEDGSNTRYISSRLEFRQTDGKVVNLWPSTMLRNQLRNVLTRSSGSNLECDPIVSITYDGMVKPAVAKEAYDFETKKDAHATTIRFDKATVRFGSGRGCLNPLNSPAIENLREYDEDMEASQITANNFNELQAGINERRQIAESTDTASMQ